MSRARVLLMAACVAVLALTSLPATAAAVQSIPSGKFQSAKSCGCHAEFVDSWSKSMHAQALDDPLYQAKLGEANRATKGALGPFCNTCHGPVATMGGEMKSGKLTAVSREAITCDFCHKIVGTGKNVGNASFVVDPGPARRAQLSDAKAPHPWALSRFHNDSRLCGTCHNVNHPVNGMHLEATYSEWAKSAYAKEGVTCQDCHMTPGAGVTKPYAGWACVTGPQRKHIYLMQWAGSNSSMGPERLTEQFLQGAATLELTAPDVIPAGGSAVVTATITNVNAGHYLPTGLTEVRQMWLEVVGTDSKGGEVLKERHEFGTVLKDAKGKHPVELWEAVGVFSDDRIAPRAERRFAYPVTMPEDGKLTLTATLYYRAAPEELAKKAEVEVPTVTMVSATRNAFGSEELAAEESLQDVDEATKGGNPNLFYMFLLGALLLAAATIWGVWYGIRNR